MTAKQYLLTSGFLLIVIFVIVLGQGTSADAQKVHALLIILGNDGNIRASVEKNESGMQTLLRQVSENCEVHMTIIKSETETIGKITRMTLSNARSTNITEQKQGIIGAKQVVQWLRDLRSNSEDTILIYYSGHGSMDAVGTHILNFDPEVTNDFVARDGLRKQLNQKSARLKMLITDTCSNRVQTLPQIARVYAKVQSKERRYTKNLFLEHTGLLDITAASAGQYAWGNDEIGGYFTVSLIGSFTADADANQDKFLSWKEVSDVTRSKTQQLFSETTFLSHNQRKLDEIGQTTQMPIAHELPGRVLSLILTDDAVVVSSEDAVLRRQDIDENRTFITTTPFWRFNVNPDGRLNVDLDIGAIDVQAAEQNRVEIVVTKEAERHLDRLIQEALADFKVTSNQTGSDVFIEGKFQRGRNYWLRQLNQLKIGLQITVPHQYNVDLNTLKDDISVDGLIGEVQARTSAGDIHVNNVVGSVETHTSAGDLRFSSIRGPILGKSSAGDITLGNCQGAVDVKTSAGDIRANVTTQPRHGWSLRTSAGDIVSTFISNIALEIDAQTSVGDISTDFRVQGTVTRKRLRGTINGGGPLLKLRTSAGDIRLQ